MLAQVCARRFPPTPAPPLLFLCRLQREHKDIVFKIVFAPFIFNDDSHDGLVDVRSGTMCLAASCERSPA